MKHTISLYSLGERKREREIEREPNQRLTDRDKERHQEGEK